MYCPNCKQEFEGKFCPECGTRMIEKPDGGFSINLGDANAISGGINLSDSHEVNNIDNSVHTSSTVNNISNNTSNVTNITNVSAQKTESEILQERKVEFMDIVNAAFSDGILEQSEIEKIEKERIRIGLDEVTAKRLVETARKNISNVRQTLSPTQVLILKQIIDIINRNDMKQLERQLPRLEILANNTLEEQPHFYYFASCAAVSPRKLIDDYESLSADEYWKTYWSYIAYVKVGDFKNAENVLFTLSRYSHYSEENITLLSAVGALREFGKETAKSLLDTVTGMYSESLNIFALSIYMLIDSDLAVELGATEEKCSFYLHNLLEFEDEETRSRRLAEEAAVFEEVSSKPHTLRLISVGSNSFKVAMILKSSLNIPLSDAKALIDCCPIDILKNVTNDNILPLAEKLKIAGAQYEII